MPQENVQNKKDKRFKEKNNNSKQKINNEIDNAVNSKNHEKEIRAKNHKITELQHQVAELKRKHNKTNSGFVQANVKLQKQVSELQSEKSKNSSIIKKLSTENASLKGRNEELYRLITHMMERNSNGNLDKSIQTESSNQFCFSPNLQSENENQIKKQDSRKSMFDLTNPELAHPHPTTIQNQISEETSNIASSEMTLLDEGESFEEEEKEKKFNLTNTMVENECSKLSHKSSHLVNDTQDQQINEPISQFDSQKRNRMNNERKKPSKQRSKISQSESKKQTEQRYSMRNTRSLRKKKPISYTEPSLTGKLRRGDRWTFGIDPKDIENIYKHPEEINFQENQ